jgi:hypothetical protein
MRVQESPAPRARVSLRSPGSTRSHAESRRPGRVGVLDRQSRRDDVGSASQGIKNLDRVAWREQLLLIPFMMMMGIGLGLVFVAAAGIPRTLRPGDGSCGIPDESLAPRLTIAGSAKWMAREALATKARENGLASPTPLVEPP